MMKKFLLFILLFFNTFFIAQTFSWVKQFKNTTDDSEESISKFKKDSSGNFYLLVTCRNYINPIITTTSTSINIDASPANIFGSVGSGLLLAKVDQNGNYLWGKFFSNLSDQDYDLALHNDNVYVSYSTNYLNGNTYYANSKISIFTNSGSLVREDEITNQPSQQFSIDDNGNLSILFRIANKALNFIDTQNQAYNSTISGLATVIVHLDQNLKVKWIKKNTDSYLESSIIHDQLNNIYFIANKTFISGYFIEKYSENGNLLSRNIFDNQRFYNVTVDSNNNLIVAAKQNCSSTNIVDIDPSPNIHLLTCGTNNPFYILWLDSDGNFIDVKEFLQIDQMVEAYPNDLFIDSSNHLHVSGRFSSMAHNVSFDSNPGNGINYLVRQGGHDDAFTVELDENRNFVKSFKLGSYPLGNSYKSRINVMAEDANAFYYVGDFRWKANFNPQGSPYQLLNTINKNTINSDGFLLKVSKCQTSPLVSSDPTVCPNSVIELRASGGTSYLWTGPNGFMSNQQNPIIQNATSVNAGTYVCTITGSGGCDGNYSVTIKVEDKTAPIPNLSTLPTITGNCKTIITTIPTATDNCMGNIIATTTNPLQYTTPGNYIIVWNYNDGNGNVSTQNQNITITSEPLPTANSTQSFCKINQPKISDLVVTGTAINYYNASGNSLNLNTLLADATKYYATQTLNGCESAKTEITVAVNDPNPPTGNNFQDFCSAQFPKISDLVATGQNIRWYDHLGTFIPASTLLSDGKTYYGTQTINGCESTQKIAVTVTINNGGIPANDYTTAFCNDTTATTKNINLNDYKGNLVANPSDYSFDFYYANNQMVPNPASENLSIGENIFNVKVYNSLGCQIYVKLKLTLNQKPILNLPPTDEFCNGKSVDLNAGSGFSSYEWTKDDDPTIIFGKQIFPVSEAGKYTVKVTNVFLCENSASIIVTESVIATITGVQIVNSTATILLSNSGNFEYSLDNLAWQDSNIFSNLPNGNYTVFVRTKLGCVIGSANFSIFSVANVFTPDADGINDTWKIDGLENYPNSEVQVYDRFGNMVLQKIINGTFEWNGTNNSRKLPTGNYWYVVKVSDGRLLNGWVLLKNRN